MAEEEAAWGELKAHAIIGMRVGAERIHEALESVRLAGEIQQDVAPRYGLSIAVAGPMNGAWFDLPCVIGVPLAAVAVRPQPGRRVAGEAQVLPTLLEMQTIAKEAKERLALIGLTERDGEIALWMCGEWLAS